MNEEKTGKSLVFRRVPHETQQKLELYAALLREWNEKINLVAKSTIPDLWTRHILDSLQLLDHLPPSAKTLADLGSGAGFPGMVLALASKLEVHLIESIGKKAVFLRTVAESLKIDVTIHHERIETIKDLHADIITARALKALPELLPLAKKVAHKDTVCFFLKGQHADAELTEAQKYWTFTLEKVPSLTDQSGVVLKIANLKEARPHDRKRKPRHR